MTEQELKTFLLSLWPKENQFCEWKDFSTLKHNVLGREGEDVISYVSGFANMDGGVLVIGIEDGTGNIIGIKDFNGYTPENLPQKLLDNVINLSSEGLKVESYTTTDTHKTVWAIHIPKHLPRKVVYAHKKAWQRNGDCLIDLTKERDELILSESISFRDDWSAEICEGATIEDLDISAIIKARENYKRKNPEMAAEVDQWDDRTFLNKAKITVKNLVTNTAILLLGKPESEHFISPALARIMWVLKDKENVEKDYRQFTCPFILSVDDVFQKIRNLKYRYIKDGTLFPEEIDQYEPYVIREALNNCIVHQDYTLAGRINVVEREDGQLIFTNVGSFIPGSVENVIKQDAPQEQYRNPFLAQAMVNLNMIDTIGSGIKRMFTFQRQRFFPMPDYDFSGNRVKVTIMGKVLDMDYARTLARNPELSLEQIIMLDKVQKKKILTDFEIKVLKDNGLVEGRKPNFHISARIAEKTGQKADYIKNRAFKDQHYKDLILEFIDKYGSASKDDVEKLLLDILPSVLDENQKENKIRNLLYAMSKRDKTIINQGSNRKPMWVRNI